MAPEQLAAERRRPVFWDENAGGWCYRIPGRAPVRADSWAAAWAAIRTAVEHGHSGFELPPAEPVRWWHRWRIV